MCLSCKSTFQKLLYRRKLVNFLFIVISLFFFALAIKYLENHHALTAFILINNPLQQQDSNSNINDSNKNNINNIESTDLTLEAPDDAHMERIEHFSTLEAWTEPPYPLSDSNTDLGSDLDSAADWTKPSLKRSSKTCKPVENVIFLRTHKTASSTTINIMFRYADRYNRKIALPANESYLN